MIAFAGDALVCVFDMKDSHVNSRICCLDALRCALELKDLRRDPLTVHIALSYGSMSLGRLGGYNDEWIYLLNGGCLAELHHCIEDASSQQIVMTEEMYDVINEELRDQEILEVEDTSSGNKRLIRLEVTDTYKSTFNRFAPFSDTGQLISLSERFVPKPVRDSLNVFKEIGELRKVTTMFINLDSYCPTANEDPVTLQPFFFMAQKALADTGGFMRQFLVDDKGCVLIGMWGVPSFSHANNSILALRCAVSIQEKSGLLKHVCSVGITTGNVYCGTVGSVLRHDYVGIGGSVNMAARLMCAAKEAVMMDEATYLLLNPESKSSMVVGRSLTLKGIPHPVVSFVFKGGEAAVSQSATEDVGSFSVVRKDVSRTLVALLRNLIASFSDEDSSCGANLVLPSSPSSGQQQHSSPLSRYGFLSPSRLGANGSNGPSHSLAAASVINSSESTDAFASKICPTINFCIIEGEAGMGRSNAANYFRTSAQLLQINCISIIARHGDETINYGVLKRLFFELVPPYIRTSAGQKEILSPLFERVLGIDYNQDEFCLQLDCLRTFLDIENPLSLKTGLLNTSDSLAIVSKGLYFEEDIIPYFDKMILELLAESRCAVVIEDAQYCDKLTWIKFASYMDVVNLNTLFLLTIHLDSNKTKKKFAHSSKLQQPGMSSPTQVGATFDVFTDVALQQQLFDSDTYIKISTNEAKCIKLVLSALTMSDIENVLMSTFKSKKVSLSLVKTVFEVSSGNPFWITSIADFICDRGSEGFAKALEAKDSQNPLNALILCRLDLLNPEHFYVAKVASIIGDEFTRDLLVHLLPDVRNISACLVALKSNGFIQSVETDSANNFEFQNPLLRTTIYDLIPPQVTFDNHLKIAKYIETTFASNLSPHYNR